MNYGKQALKRREKSIDSSSIRTRNKICVIFFEIILVCILIVGISGVSAGIGVMKGIIDSAPDISEIDVIPTGYSTTVLASDGSQIATLVASGANRQYVTIDEIPIDLQHAFVAIEDSRFYEHNGIDLKGIARAFSIVVKSHSLSQGASTITQQLIKNSVLESTWESESSDIEKLQRKIQEQYLAIQLEKQVDNKDWILENYLNTINLGANTLGVQAASEKYFGKDVSELELSECAVIAAITQNPYKYNPILHPDKNAERRAKVLENMKTQGYISPEEYNAAVEDDVYSRIAEHNTVTDDSDSINSYYVDAMIDDVYDDLINLKGYTQTEAYKAIYQGGLTIYSAQDLKLQKICDEEVNDKSHYATGTKYSFALSFQIKKKDGTFKTFTHQTMLAYYKEVNHNNNYSINYSSEEACREAIKEYEKAMCKEENGKLVKDSESITITLQPEVALTIIDQSTGEVKALVGGRGDKTSNRTWNRATDTTRQPGSTFKIIGCFAPAIDGGGKTLASTQKDAPLTVGTKTYRNYDGSYRGITSIRTAITYSINIVTVKNLQDIGIDLGYEYSEKFGISTLVDTDRNLGLSLGGLTYGVKNVELAGAYAAIANKGEYIEPSFYSKVLDHDGNVILDISDKDHHRVIREASAYLLTSAMEDVMTQGTGKRCYFGDKMAQAGKSGTTTSNRDSLFAGFTPYYTCVLWGGYDDNAKLSSTTYTKEIWHDIMERIHEDLEPIEEFEKPDSVVELKVCKNSGLLARSGCSTITEYFDVDNAPEETCSSHSYTYRKKKTTESSSESSSEDSKKKTEEGDSDSSKKKTSDTDNSDTDTSQKKSTDDASATKTETKKTGAIEEDAGNE